MRPAQTNPPQAAADGKTKGLQHMHVNPPPHPPPQAAHSTLQGESS